MSYMIVPTFSSVDEASLCDHSFHVVPSIRLDQLSVCNLSMFTCVWRTFSCPKHSMFYRRPVLFCSWERQCVLSWNLPRAPDWAKSDSIEASLFSSNLKTIVWLRYEYHSSSKGKESDWVQKTRIKAASTHQRRQLTLNSHPRKKYQSCLQPINVYMCLKDILGLKHTTFYRRPVLFCSWERQCVLSWNLPGAPDWVQSTELNRSLAL